MDITIKRAHFKDETCKEIVLSDFSGILHEYNGYQFCIGCKDLTYMAIELQTGWSIAKYESEVNDPVDYCIDLIKWSMTKRTQKEYDYAIGSAKENMRDKGFKIPINKQL